MGAKFVHSIDAICIEVDTNCTSTIHKFASELRFAPNRILLDAILFLWQTKRRSITSLNYGVAVSHSYRNHLIARAQHALVLLPPMISISLTDGSVG